MKVLKTLFCVLVSLVLLAACSSAPPSALSGSQQDPVLSAGQAPTAGADIAFITADGSQDQQGQELWSLIGRFAGEAGMTSGSYTADADVLGAVELAVRGGAKLIVMQGEALAAFAGDVQGSHPGVDFIFIDMPEDTPLRSNGTLVLYAADQGGWLAGYAAVYEGETDLGYLNAPTRSAQQYALGFLLGAEAAAADMSLAEPVRARSVDLGPADEEAGQAESGTQEQSADEPDPASSASDSAGGGAPLAPEDQIAGLFERGAQLVFSNYQAVQSEVLAATKSARAKMIGVGLSMAPAGNAALTTVVNHPDKVLGRLLEGWNNGDLPGGQPVYGTVAEGAVELLIEDSGLVKLTEAKYQQLVSRFEAGTLSESLAQKTAPDGAGHFPDPDQLSLENVVLGDAVADTSASTAAQRPAGTGTGQQAPPANFGAATQNTAPAESSSSEADASASGTAPEQPDSASAAPSADTSDTGAHTPDTSGGSPAPDPADEPAAESSSA